MANVNTASGPRLHLEVADNTSSIKMWPRENISIKETGRIICVFLRTYELGATGRRRGETGPNEITDVTGSSDQRPETPELYLSPTYRVVTAGS